MTEPTPTPEDEESTLSLGQMLELEPHTQQALKAVALPVVGVFVCLFMDMIIGKAYFHGNAVKCLTFPIVMFFMLNRDSEKLRAIMTDASPKAMGWSLCLFLLVLMGNAGWAAISLMLAVIVGCFVYVSPRGWWQLLRAEGARGMVVLAGALSGMAVVFIQKAFWASAARLTMLLMSIYMAPVYNHVHLTTRNDITRQPQLARVAERAGLMGQSYVPVGLNYNILVADQHLMTFNQAHNAFNAAFIMLFMLALLLLYREDLFEGVSLPALGVGAALWVVLVQPLALSMLFIATHGGAFEGADSNLAALNGFMSLRANMFVVLAAHIVFSGAYYALALRHLKKPAVS